jgi:hypothetical protein
LHTNCLTLIEKEDNKYFCVKLFIQTKNGMPPVRVELTTPGLRDQCSAPELKGLDTLIICLFSCFFLTHSLKKRQMTLFVQNFAQLHKKLPRKNPQNHFYSTGQILTLISTNGSNSLELTSPNSFTK